MLSLILFLVFGFFIGYIQVIPNFFEKHFLKILNASLIAILIGLGAKLGSSDTIIKNINILGFYSIILAILSIAGSIGVVYLLEKCKLLSFTFEEMTDKEEEVKYNILPIIFSLFFGIILGKFILSIELLKFLDYIILSGLYLMIFCIGIDLGFKKTILEDIKVLGFKVFFIPLAVFIGAVLGGFFASFILKIPVNVSIAIAAGCGFYSATGPIITEVISVEMGMVAFLANLFREIVTFILVPIVSKRLSELSAIAIGGATAMDSTLPVIIKCSGKNYALLAIISGMFLTAIVPILVPIIANL